MTRFDDLSKSVEDNDGVIHRVASNGEDGTDMKQREFLSHENSTTGGDDTVMNQCNDGTDGEGGFKSKHKVKENAKETGNDGDDGLLGHFSTDHGSYGFQFAGIDAILELWLT